MKKVVQAVVASAAQMTIYEMEITIWKDNTLIALDIPFKFDSCIY
jgi:hypothetical protein